MRVFNRTSQVNGHWAEHYSHGNDSAFLDIILTCSRDDSHKLRFNCLVDSGTIQKTGQFPSFADIALDESKEYSKLLSKRDAAEFHRAIGLAAHNIGIGSFVYLRRIFERLITDRFEEFKGTEQWRDEDFYAVRMEDKIQLLKNHLPPFLVKNHKIYSILSVGIHALEEDQCLAFFKVLRQSLILILEEDKKKKEELEMQQELQKAIAGFTTQKSPTPEITLATLGEKPPEPQKGSAD